MAGDCQAATKALTRERREALRRDPKSCAALVADLKTRAVERVQRVTPDGRLPGHQLVTVRLSGSKVPTTFTVVTEQNEWKVSGL